VTRLRLAEAALGLALVALSAVIFYDLATLSAGPGYARVGPKAFPRLVAIGMALIGAGLVAAALREGAARALPAIDWGALGLAALGVVAVVLTLSSGGFAVASALLVALTARAFGSRRLLLDLVIGFLLGFVCLLVFGLALGVTLPWGPLEGLRRQAVG